MVVNRVGQDFDEGDHQNKVKTEIASQLFEALGYQPSTKQLGAQISYEALNLGEIDAFFGAWLPAQQGMYDTVNAKGSLVDLGNNVDGARMGFAVPRYVAEAGLVLRELAGEAKSLESIFAELTTEETAPRDEPDLDDEAAHEEEGR